MKKLVLILSLFVLQTLAHPTEEVIDQAYKLYEQKNYTKALELYQTIDNKNWAILYNMGNSAYNLGNFIEAFVYWKQAQKNAPTSELADINYNLTLVRQKLPLQDEPKTFFEKTYEKIVYYTQLIPLWLLQCIFLVSWFALFFYIRKRYNDTKYKVWLLGVLAALNSLLVCSLFIYYLETRHEKGIIVKENSTLFVGPNEQYHSIKTLPLAAQVSIIQQQDNWYKIRHKNSSGWVLKTSLAVI